MDSWYDVTESPTTVALPSNEISNGTMPSDDQFFLLYFVMGTYFGPDLKQEGPQKSVLQRKAQGLPPYTSDQLAGSHMKTVEVERIYFYVLRKADPSVIVKLPMLRQFFQGKLPSRDLVCASSYLQFSDLFPPQLHPHARSESQYKVIENIVFINNPEISSFKPEDIERFKRLTGLENILLNRDAARMFTNVDTEVLNNAPVLGFDTNGEFSSPKTSHISGKTRRVDEVIESVEPLPYVHEPIPLNCVPWNGTTMTFPTMAPQRGIERRLEDSGPAMIYLPSRPTVEEWENIVAATRSGSALTGSAAKGQIGPVVGLMDIGEHDDSYIFRVSLPGVKRDGRDFSCEVETDGKVVIRGVTTTGEKTVYRLSEVFEMQSQNLCPPGHFSILFHLPGPVDPQQFSGNFGTDGILEGIVRKKERKQ